MIAIAVSAVFEPPFSWRITATDAVLKAAALVSGAALIWVSWFVLGARPRPTSFLASYSYWFAAWLLIVALLIASDAGFMRLVKPDWFATVSAVTSSGQDTQRLKALVGSEGAYALKAVLESDQGLSAAIRVPGFLWIVSMAAFRGAFTLAWLFLFWNQCRKTLALGWSRAAMSLAVFLCLTAIAASAGILIQMEPIMVDPGLWFEKWPFLRRWVEAL